MSDDETKVDLTLAGEMVKQARLDTWKVCDGFLTAEQAESAAWRRKYEELAAAVDAYAQCRGTEAERIHARIQMWSTRNHHKVNE